ncbi:MAG TPA: DUF3857 and transglutaminase domain-containing protein [Mucilaginibacter sp.]|nr:DUF3857 and transglutaminase domain-containing protein [Mucilaginibacter sp.]
MITLYKFKYLVALTGFCLVFIRAYCQDIPKEVYSATGIPDSLKQDAGSVVRYCMEDYDVKGPGKATHKIHSVVTVLNEKGDHEGLVELPYNKKFNTINSFEMRVYDAAGTLLKKYHKSDMYDGAVSMEATLISDDRFLGLRHSFASYPETVEVDYEESINSIINIGSWDIQGTEQSIQDSYCHVSIGADAGFRFSAKNTSVKPDKTSSGSTDNYLWHVSGLKAFKDEERSKPWRVLPKVRFAANKFDFYDYPGDFSSWQSFGKWQQMLNADVESLSSQRAAEIKKMTDTIKTDKDKARFLYKYLQNNMRYVNIVLGIGGLKPLPATFVDEKKYGDCKALSNYMRAMLKAAGINSYYAIVDAGENAEPEDPSFPYDISNHIILCIPFKNDTTWLECTSTKAEFGKLGSFTENRNALLITENGGQLVNTPKTKAVDNQFNCEQHMTLQPDGSAKTHISLKSTGEYRLLYLETEAAKTDEQKQFWLEELQIKQPSVFNFESGKDANGEKQVDLDMEYDKFCDVMAGDKQFYRTSVFKLWGNTVPVSDSRKTDFYWEWPRIKSCTTIIDLPQGYEVESLPANSSLKFTYGSYAVSYTYNKDKNQVTGTAKFILNNAMIPAAKYTEMQQFMDDIARAQNKKLVLRKKA